jgi:uncharacterized membrane protein
MSRFVVVTFEDETGAREAIETLKALDAERRLVLHGAGTVVKDAAGALSMRIVSDAGSAAVATGALIGGLAGLGVGLLGAAIMAAGGAVFGASAGLTNRGAGKKVMEEVSRRLPNNSAAVVADVDLDDLAVLEDGMKPLKGHVHEVPPDA